MTINSLNKFLKLSEIVLVFNSQLQKLPKPAENFLWILGELNLKENLIYIILAKLIVF